MGDHFVFLVDRLITESTLEAVIESRNPAKQLDPRGGNDNTIVDCSSHVVFAPRKLAECRICQDEDFDSNMETPCACCGSLKYAHRRCVQRWCNEKGDTICEICHQQFMEGYTAPSPVFRFGGLPVNLRGHWQIARRDTNNDPRFDQEYDEYADSASRSFLCFRMVAVIFMVLLILRHGLPLIANGAGTYSFRVLVLMLLRMSGIIVAVYVMLRAVAAIHRRWQLASNASSSSSDMGEHQPDVLRVH